MINLLPCVEVKKPEPLTVSLPFGGELKSMIDPSLGPPTDCTLAHSLMLQLTPMLASFACVFKVLGVIGAMQKFFDSKTPPDLISNASDVAKAIGDMKSCIDIVLGPIPIVCMVCDILR